MQALLDESESKDDESEDDFEDDDYDDSDEEESKKTTSKISSAITKKSQKDDEHELVDSKKCLRNGQPKKVKVPIKEDKKGRAKGLPGKGGDKGNNGKIMMTQKEAIQAITEFMIKKNRPHYFQNVIDNLQERIKKPQGQKILDDIKRFLLEKILIKTRFIQLIKTIFQQQATRNWQNQIKKLKCLRIIYSHFNKI